MSHVGRHFDLFVDGKPLRIVVVGQESGFPKDAPELRARVTLGARYQQVHDLTGLDKRYYATGTHKGRNPHMRGTTSALRILMGTGEGTDYEGEVVKPNDGKPFHIFDGFALVNRLLCSAAPPGSSNGRPTATMFANCGEHFSATMKILEPTIVVIQGRAVGKWVKPILVPSRAYDDHHHEAFLGSHRMIVCTFSHPSAHGAHRWGDQPTAPYLRQVVRPTLRKALLKS
ncbi:hypothetical protein A5730_16485 [Mycobacterium sp. ACS4054]|nr:hypothetical protein A5730_16485 [Mycobacterium sp. ACS4054]